MRKPVLWIAEEIRTEVTQPTTSDDGDPLPLAQGTALDAVIR